MGAKISDFNTTTPDAADLVPVVDVSDTAQGPAGSTRKFTLQAIADWFAALSITFTNKTHTSPVINTGFSGSAKATGAEIITGTEDAKIVTPKAIADADLAYSSEVPVKATGAEVDTGTNDAKFLTPKSLVDSSLNAAWTPARETWAYASATTITVPTGAASRYQIGDKYKLTANSVVLYGVIIAVANTVLTVAGNALTNHAFTANYYSRATNPFGFPASFTYTAELFGSGGTKGSYAQAFGLNGGVFSTQGRICTVWASARISNVGSWSSAVYLNIPIPPSTNVTTGGHAGGVIITDGQLNTVKAISSNVSTTSGGILQFNRTYGATEPAWTDLAANDWFIVHFSYPF